LLFLLFFFFFFFPYLLLFLSLSHWIHQIANIVDTAIVSDSEGAKGPEQIYRRDNLSGI
jgi:hypothetical protein